MGFSTMRFLDAFSEYHQIKMHESNVPHTAFTIGEDKTLKTQEKIEITRFSFVHGLIQPCVKKTNRQ
ncbi:hypothetical protein KSP40_PGU010380 [Platanthera guangdongensis]|uniref:Uncharacterized protein n=1 Tax=Platanthera guangdongensis TaxID=2320717 RepID=A0ABR2MI67_9ASPA